jgi:hypothetical protein
MKTSLGKVRRQLAYGYFGGCLAHVMAAYFVCHLAGAGLTSIPTLIAVYGTLAALALMNISTVLRAWRYISLAAGQELKWSWSRALAYGVYGDLALPRPAGTYGLDDYDYDYDEAEARSKDWDYMRDYAIPLGLLDRKD